MLYYFAQSPFFDSTSNNAIVFTQAQITSPETLSTRQAFEEELSKRSGLEFRVAQSHLKYGPDAPINNGRWVIRKQRREKQSGRLDKITVLATYFVIGDVVLMAPSIGNVLWGKLLDAMHNFEDFTTQVSTLPIFTPALGHHYLRQSLTAGEPSSRSGSTLPSRTGSPTPGQEDIAMPSTQESSETAKGSTNQTAADKRTLYNSLQTFMKYGNEYMDEVELVGEPGNFSFKRNDAPKSQQTNVITSQANRESQDSAASASTREPKETASPRIKTEDTEPTPESQPLRPNPKRKKSKAIIVGPIDV